MFTGIIEATAIVDRVEKDGANKNFCLASTLTGELKVDQSLAHNGVCLTVTRVDAKQYWVTAINETLQKSNLGKWKAGDLINLERSMPAYGRFDGHIVQGHVDQVGVCDKVTEADGSWVFDFKYDAGIGNITVEKGSIAINGVSLTCFNARPGSFTVAIIPYTFEHTNFGTLRAGDQVNLEFDILGKYIRRLVGTA
ncbi:MAG TPA: riboflavin synthase [Cyclobacteriaceae bacterium]|nr:riboflavin synthase [Cyclobacteriaceae bacterium]HQQ97793.1 riboflavin synthase [Cyclobacteriaceae bacterium]